MAPKAVINYIHGGLLDDKYHSKKQRPRLVCLAFVRKRVHTVQCTFTDKSVRSIDGPITFPPIDSNRVILPHEDALVLSLGVGGFDVHKILIYLGSSTDLLQMLAYKQMEYSPSTLEHSGYILTGFKGASTVSLGDVVLPI